ncbi:MAG: hypothetical protein WBW47_08830, partial [Thermoplasmata archaeon]
MGEFGKNLIRAGLVATVVVAVVVAFLAGSAASPVTGTSFQTATVLLPHATSPTVVTACTESALSSAVALGGVVDYGASCTVPFTSAITIPSTLNVTISGNGYTVTFNGQSSTRLFVVTGGILAIDYVTIENGRVTGAAGTAGTTGTAGSDGTAGSAGAS